MGKSLHFWGTVGLASLLLAFKGSGSTNVLDNLALVAFEETHVLASTTEVSPSQVLDMNTISAQGIGSDLGVNALSTVQNTFLIPRTATLATLFEEDERTGNVTYVVQEGDVLGGIASDFGITLQTIISANKIANIDAIKPGTELTIPPVSGVVVMVKKGDTVSSLAKKYSADQDKIISYNGLPLAGDLRIGDEIIIPGGTPPAASKAPTKAITGGQRFAGLPKFEGYFINSATCRITNLSHGRNGRDCAAAVGTPIYAAASGQVEIADGSGYNGGYGKYVRIKHGNGTSTLYAHLSKVQVVPGETISQGQQLGLMGSTGRSTGSHLHIECHGCQNPLAGYKLGAQVVAKQ
ncbi:MAG: peptidoglycan DD-metalloendopeptidase family protein [Patescibacteria group bacterium]